MGVRERVVTEFVCDICKKAIGDGAGKIGALEAKTAGARGRGERWMLVFHDTCYRELVSLATKPMTARRLRGGAAQKPASAKRAVAGGGVSPGRKSRRARAEAAEA